jgi:hypothetical protein
VGEGKCPLRQRKARGNHTLLKYFEMKIGEWILYKRWLVINELVYKNNKL